MFGGKNDKKYHSEKNPELYYTLHFLSACSVSYKNAVASRVHAINSVLVNNTSMYLNILVRAQFIVLGRNMVHTYASNYRLYSWVP